MALIIIDKDNVRSDQFGEAFIQTQAVMIPVAQCSQPIRDMQMVCEHPQQIIDLQRQMSDLQTRQFLPPTMRAHRAGTTDTNSECKGTYACLWLCRDQDGNIRDTVAHVASSDLRCRSVEKIIGEDISPHEPSG
jgi:hypothetical protein